MQYVQTVDFIGLGHGAQHQEFVRRYCELRHPLGASMFNHDVILKTLPYPPTATLIEASQTHVVTRSGVTCGSYKKWACRHTG